MERHADGKRRPGRPARDEPAEQIGYRATESTRRHLDVARGFTGHRSSQQLIDEAVQSYLRSLRATNANYQAAAEALDLELRRAATETLIFPHTAS